MSRTANVFSIRKFYRILLIDNQMVGSKFRSALATFVGVIAAIAAAECAMRPFFIQHIHRTTLEIRQYQEGISVSHFFRADPAPEWCRETGNDMIMGAPNLLILGDSHVGAKSLSDRATMGFLIENWSRTNGQPVNVLQCGFSSGTAATYAGVAEKMISTWKPKWVIIVLNDRDLGDEIFWNSVRYRLKLSPKGAAKIYEHVEPRRHKTTELEHKSALWQTLHYRWDLIFAQQKIDTVEKEKIKKELITNVPAASVTLLKQAYGNKLVVIFFPLIDRHSNPAPGESELRLQKECITQGIPFASSRQEFLKLKQKFIYTRGFHNTEPGFGHMNEEGHLALAEIAWKLLNGLDRQTQTSQKMPDNGTSAR